MNKLIIPSVIIILFISIVTVYGLRSIRPPILKYPLDEGQVKELNNFMENMWNMQYGRYEMDIVTTTKTNAKNGEAWLIQTGNTIRIQIKGNGSIYTFTPDGY